MKLKKKTAAYHRGVEDAVCVPQRRSHSQGIEIKKESEERESFFSAGRYDKMKKITVLFPIDWKKGKNMAAAVLNVWPLSNYGFGSKACESPARDRSEAARLERLRAR